MIDCFDFYLWTIGELPVSPKLRRKLFRELKQLNQTQKY